MKSIKSSAIAFCSAIFGWPGVFLYGKKWVNILESDNSFTAFSIYPGQGDPFWVAFMLPKTQIMDAFGYLALMLFTKFWYDRIIVDSSGRTVPKRVASRRLSRPLHRRSADEVARARGELPSTTLFLDAPCEAAPLRERGPRPPSRITRRWSEPRCR